MTNVLKLSENIARLRKEKRITQESLADFIGVTKASVSKWENGQSLPDILILPQLAAYFDVTVDELLGYEAKLTREQIRKLYETLAEDYANLPFEEVTEKTERLVHRYYSCYPFLLQICVLWLNHFMLAKDEKKQQELLEKGAALCGHIIENCREITVCNEAVALKAVINLQLGKAEEVISQLEGMIKQQLWRQSDGVLINAYLVKGNTEEAYSYAQIVMYVSLLSLVSTATKYLYVNMGNPRMCEETMEKTEGIIRLYDLSRLHPNAAAQYYYQAALCHMAQGEKEKALEKLKGYEQAVSFLFGKEQVVLHGNAYFDRLEEWINRLELGGMPPRNMRLVEKNVMEALGHPLFAQLLENREFQRIKKCLEEGVKRYDDQ